MDKKTVVLKAVGLFTLAVLLAACGGGGGGGGTPGTVTDPGAQQTTNPPPGGSQSTAPAFSGYNYSLKQGDFWQYGWHMQGSSYAQGSTPSSYNYSGEFRVTLGAPTTIAGITAFPLIFSGQPHEWTRHFVHDRWAYLAVDGNRIYGSVDGVSLTELFDAQDGTLLGSGFFQPFSSTNLYAIKSGSINNEFVQSTAEVVESSASTGQCEYFPEIGQTICGGGMSTNYTEQEFYQSGVGPIGYYYYLSYSSCGGGFCSGATDKLDIGLTASSLRGDVAPGMLEQEPNNAIAQANALQLPATVRGGFYGEGEYGPTSTYASVTTTPEFEPNDGVTNGGAPQYISIPSRISGTGAASLSVGEIYTNPSLPANPFIEDWYRITPLVAGNYTVDLSFNSGVPGADLDLYVMRASDGALMGWSGANNPVTGVYTESVTFTAGNVPYYIGVDAYAPSSPTVAYTMDVHASNSPLSFTPTDWYSFSLVSPSAVTISATGNVRLVLMGAANNILNAAVGTIASGTLSPGTYRIGVIRESGSSNNYDLSVQ